MSSAAVEITLARLPREEGRRLLPYDDATGLPVKAPKGNLSWGDGFDLMECGSPGLFAVMDRYLLEQEEIPLLKLPWYAALDAVRQSVCLDIAYNDGVHGLLGFPHMIAALGRQDWATASTECAVEDPKLNASRYAPLRQLLLIGSTT